MKFHVFCLTTLIIVGMKLSFAFSQQPNVKPPTTYKNVTMEDRRAGIFGASRSKMFDPSTNWSNARETVATQRTDQRESMLLMISNSDTLENSRAGGMNMFLTVGGRLQNVMAIGDSPTQDVATLETADLVTLDDNVNQTQATAVVSETGIYTPRILQVEYFNEVDIPMENELKNDWQTIVQERLNDCFQNTSGFSSISLKTESGLVVLQGTVASESDREIAELILRLEPEVLRVKNELQVENH